MSHPFLQLSEEEQAAPIAEAIDWGQRRSPSHRHRIYDEAKGFDSVVTLGAANSIKPVVPKMPGRTLIPSDVEFLASEIVPKCMVNIMRDKNVFWYNRFLQDTKLLDIKGLVNVLGNWGDEIYHVIQDLHQAGHRSIFLNFDAQAQPMSLLPDICNTLQAILTFDMYPAKLFVNSFVADRFIKGYIIDSFAFYIREVSPLFPEFRIVRGFRESSDMANQTLMEYTYFIRKDAA